MEDMQLMIVVMKRRQTSPNFTIVMETQTPHPSKETPPRSMKTDKICFQMYNYRLKMIKVAIYTF